MNVCFTLLFISGITDMSFIAEKQKIGLEIINKNGYKLPKPSLKNMIYLFNISSRQFDKELDMLDLEQKGYMENCRYFSTKYEPLKGYFTITRCPSGLMTFEWSAFKSPGFLNDIIYDLEDYYLGKEESMDVYGFKLDGKNYEFSIGRTPEIEIIFLR